MAEKRKAWEEAMGALEIEKLVFLDESGSNVNMTRKYGRAKGKERVKDDVPFSKPKNATVLSSLRLNGTIAHTVYTGGTTGVKFLTYLKDTLLPTLHKGDIVVMDNLRTHHIEEVRTVLENAGMQILYLPPYSPDFNPIEMMWSKVKAYLRKLKKRTAETLMEGIEEALKLITREDCVAWFTHAGYS